ncbi:MAG: tetratricopeptide repeat protein [Acidobacteria bacterium]|nr:tetratricopeptide repeat protein [Acidobacteriota bacterium]
MKRILVFLFLLTIVGPAAAQSKKSPKSVSKTAKPAAESKATPTPGPTPTPSPTPTTAERFNAIAADPDLRSRIEALIAFAKDEGITPELSGQALELASASRAALADQMYEAGEKEAAIGLFREAITNAPSPASDRLFAEILIRIPGSLLLKSEGKAAVEAARDLEPHAAGKVDRLLALVTFHTSIENGTDVVRLSEAASLIEPPAAAAFRALALAHRLNFDIEAAEAAQRKALEIEPGSVDIKRELADLLRANGKSKDAIPLYQSIIEADENNAQARAGLAMALYETGERAAAEAELDRAIKLSPENFMLMTAAAYWYAANGFGDKAIEFAEDSIEMQPRYVWSYIALARGHSIQNKPVEAEKALARAKQYGNFPSLNYEIALVRMDAGFFREAAEEMNGVVEVADGNISARLGGRVQRSAASLPELLRDERRASIFAPGSPADAERAARLAALTAFFDGLNTEGEETLNDEALGRFIAGDDKMRVHRELFAATLLLEKGVGTEKALELIASATDQTDAALGVSNPSAAVMASELYESRRIAFIRNEYLLVPDVPRQTLSAIMRGRIEELAGWALYREGKFADAAVRLQRAISVLPPDSAWWRSSKWRLGEALFAVGKPDEALDQFIAGYDRNRPDYFKYTSIKSVYQQVKGSIEGLEDRIGPNPFPEAAPETKDVAVSVAPENEDPKPEEKKAAQVVEPEMRSDTTEKKPEVPSEPETKKEIPADDKPAEKIPTSAAETAESKPVVPVEAKPEEKAEAPKPETSEAASAKKTDDTNVAANDQPETKPADAVTKPVTGEAKPTADEASRSKKIFEPIVIEIGRNRSDQESTPVPKAEEKTAEVKSEATAGAPAKTEAAPSEKVDEPVLPKSERTEEKAPPATEATEKPRSAAPAQEGQSKDPDAEKPTSESAPVGRPRIVPGQAIAEDTARCSIAVSQETVTLMNNGGNIGLLVSFDGGDGSIEARSSNPDDVEVRREAAIAGLTGRAYFVIRSLTDRKGIFQVLFSTSCGDKLISVNVR